MMTDPGKDLQQQIAYYERKHELNPGARVFAPLADLYRKAGRLQEAVHLLQEGLELHPHYVSALVILGRCHIEAGDWTSAREAFQKVLTKDPDNLVVLKLMADDAAERQDWRAATGLLERVVLLDPTDEPAESELTRIRDEQGDRIAAQPDTVVSEAGSVPDGKGNADQPVAMDEGRPPLDRPAEDMTEPHEVEPAAPVADLIEPKGQEAPGEDRSGTQEAQTLATKTLADIYLAQGYRDKALAVLRQILARQPDRQDVRDKIAEISGGEASPEGTGEPAGADEEPLRGVETTGKDDRRQFANWLDKLSREPQNGE